jgi:hypothetical protein
MLPRSMSVGSRSRLVSGRLSHINPDASGVVNLRPRLWSGYVSWSYDRRLQKAVPGLSTLFILGIVPTREEYIYESDSDRVGVFLKDCLVPRNHVESGMSWNARPIVRLSYFYSRDRRSGRYLKVPKGLLTRSGEHRFSNIYAEAVFLGWLSKRLPQSLETGILPPSNHKTWSDRTWMLYRQLSDSLL